MLKKRVTLVVTFFVLVFLFTACGSPQKDTSNQKKTDKTTSQHFPVHVVDATGKTISISKQPDRIVSLIPSNTEILYALGLGKHIVGVTNNDDYPSDVKNKEKVGGYQLNIEKIISLHPDLVVAQSLNPKQAITQLRSAGIKVAVIKNPSSFNGVYQSIDMIGKLTGTKTHATNIVKNMKQNLTTIQKKIASHHLKKKKVWVEISPPPEIYTAGKGTFMNEMLSTIGAKNAAGGLKGYPKVSEEQGVKNNPDIIILTYGGKPEVNKVLHRKAWKNVPAIQNNQVYTIDSNIVSRPGPRLIKGVEQLAKIVYPSLFN